MKLSGGNINLENVNKVMRTSASDIRKTDGREFVVDSLMYMLKWGNMVKSDDLKITRAALFWIF